MNSDLLQVVFDAINLEIWILDKEFRFLTFNKKFKEMVQSLHNYNIEEGANLEDLINPTGLEIWKNRYESVFDGETKSFFIKQIIEGKEVYFDVIISPIFDDEKRVQLVCGIARPFDPEHKSITELTSLANLFLGNLHHKFLNTINWELKAPINTALEYLASISPDNTSVIRKEEILDLKATIEILKLKLDLVNDFSKIDKGELNLSEQRFSISELLEKIESISYQLKSNITNKFKISFSSDLPVVIKGDKIKVQNLIFIVIEGIFEISNYNIITMSVSCENYADSVSTLFFKFTCESKQNSNVKIPLTEEKFYDSLGSKSNNFKSYLFTHYLILLKGDCTVYSHGNYDEIVIRLNLPQPVKMTLIKEGGILENNKKVLNNLNVLIVEDSTVNQKVIAALLSNYGAKTTQCLSGEEALEVLAHSTFDIILMDIAMPGLSGIETTIEIREKFEMPVKDIPVIALTGSSIREHKEGIAKARINGYLSKPVSGKDLVNAITSLLGSSNQIEKNEVSQPIEKLSIIDLSYLNNVAAGDKTFLVSIINDFIENFPNWLKELEVAFQVRDTGRIKSLSHKMKPAAEYIGLNKESNLLKSILGKNSSELFEPETLNSLNILAKKMPLVLEELENELQKLT